MRQIFRLLAIAALLIQSSCGGGGGGDSSGPKTNACDVLGLQTKIVHGSECDDSNSPVVLIQLEDTSGVNYLCSGTLLTQNYILTAAHCFFGNIRYAAILAHGSLIYADTVTLHPQVSVQSSGITNDAAILHLRSNANLPTASIYSSASLKSGDIISIFGYGQTEHQSDSNDTAGVLRSGQMAITSIDGDHILAVFDGSGSDTCFGDSGGPAFFSSNGKTGLVGITSSGSSTDCSSGDQSLFANLQSASIINFVRQVVSGAPEI